MSQTISYNLDDLFDSDAYKNAAEMLRDGADQVQEPGWAKLTGEAVMKQIGGALGDAIDDTDLIDLFGEGWAKSAELLAYGDPAKHKPNTTSYVRLGHFEQDQDLDLVTTLKFAGLEGKPLTFTVTFSADFNGIELAIRNGRIKRMLGGTCELSAKLMAGGKVLWPGKKIKKFPLLGEHRFKRPGIALPGASRYDTPQPS
jgi:hypothetical protein